MASLLSFFGGVSLQEISGIFKPEAVSVLLLGVHVLLIVGAFIILYVCRRLGVGDDERIAKLEDRGQRALEALQADPLIITKPASPETAIKEIIKDMNQLILERVQHGKITVFKSRLDLLLAIEPKELPDVTAQCQGLRDCVGRRLEELPEIISQKVKDKRIPISKRSFEENFKPFDFASFKEDDDRNCPICLKPFERTLGETRLADAHVPVQVICGNRHMFGSRCLWSWIEETFYEYRIQACLLCHNELEKTDFWRLHYFDDAREFLQAEDDQYDQLLKTC